VRSYSERPLRIVAIGGGTGLSTVLSGLKMYTRPWANREDTGVPPDAPLIEIAAIVTVTDDGGSSGRLRRDFDLLPPGDIRNCMVALSEDAALLSRLFQYRFGQGRGLKGHSFGNLFLAALTHVMNGDFAAAVKVSSEVLAIAGNIFPSTDERVQLEATMANGKRVAGETRISRARSRIQRIRLIPETAHPLPETLHALAQADLITLGPGSLFTSLVPNLLVQGIPEAIAASPAVKAHFVNLMWQPHETMNFTAADHIRALEGHAGAQLLDCIVINDRPISPHLASVYEESRARPVLNDLNTLTGRPARIVACDLLMEGNTVRHNPAALARIAVELAEQGRRQRIEREATSEMAHSCGGIIG
jgi:uncharacterized cofD-like protein